MISRVVGRSARLVFLLQLASICALSSSQEEPQHLSPPPAKEGCPAALLDEETTYAHRTTIHSRSTGTAAHTHTKSHSPSTSASTLLPHPVQYTVPCSRHYEFPIKGTSRRVAGCTPGIKPDTGSSSASAYGQCGRYIQDGFLTSLEVSKLKDMMNKAFSIADLSSTPISTDDGATTTTTTTTPSSSGTLPNPLAGPSIADINSGFVKASGGELLNMYKSTATPKKASSSSSSTVNFTQDEFALYRDVFDRLKRHVTKTFNLTEGSLYFTAPTFVTRTIGDPFWKPQHIHDEYFHPHADKANTAHYDYSALVYLSTYGEDDEDGGSKKADFSGGKFAFLSPREEPTKGESMEQHAFTLLDAIAEKGEVEEETNTRTTSSTTNAAAISRLWKEDHIVEPVAGRVLIFTAGVENVHQVQKVLKGTRFVLSCWFTCDSRREFTHFLDGEAHVRFNGGGGGGGVGVKEGKDEGRRAHTSDSTPTTSSPPQQTQGNEESKNKKKKTTFIERPVPHEEL